MASLNISSFMKVHGILHYCVKKRYYTEVRIKIYRVATVEMVVPLHTYAHTQYGRLAGAGCDDLRQTTNLALFLGKVLRGGVPS